MTVRLICQALRNRDAWLRGSFQRTKAVGGRFGKLKRVAVPAKADRLDPSMFASRAAPDSYSKVASKPAMAYSFTTKEPELKLSPASVPKAQAFAACYQILVY